jgi:hypothetical protein
LEGSVKRRGEIQREGVERKTGSVREGKERETDRDRWEKDI